MAKPDNSVQLTAFRAAADAEEPFDAALIFAPVGALVPAALRAVRPGGVVVCAGIHMSDIRSVSANRHAP